MKKKPDPLAKRFDAAQRAAVKAGECIVTYALAVEDLGENPERVVTRLLDLFYEVAAMYVLLLKALQISAQVSGVALQPVVDEMVRTFRKKGGDPRSHS